MATTQIQERNFYAATSDELQAVQTSQSDQEQLELQHELALKIAPGSAHGQGYTNADTFRAVMSGPAYRYGYSQETEPGLYRDLEAVRYTAGEPFAFQTGTGGLGYLGVVLDSQHAEHPGESLIYSVRKVPGRSVHELGGERLWGQALIHHWRTGITFDGINTSWAFEGADEVAVIERATDRSQPVVRTNGTYFTGLIGMQSIREHYRDKDRRNMQRLPKLYAEVLQKVGEMSLIAPGNKYPPTNNR